MQCAAVIVLTGCNSTIGLVVDIFDEIFQYYTGWPKLKYPSSKFAISWQQHKILRPNLQQLLSTNQQINPQNCLHICKTHKFKMLQR